MTLAKTYVASASGRCGIVGNPSDIYGGKVLSCSIPARATCRLTVGGDSGLPEDLRLWNAAIARFPIEGPVKVEWSTDVPRSSGLSGSTALLAATLACVLAARDELGPGRVADLESDAGRVAYAELVRDVERYEADVMCGYQDAYMICNGYLRLMDFAGKHPVNPGPFGTLKKLDADLPFLLVTTGVERLSGSVHGPMAQRWVDGDSEVVETMRRLPILAEVAADALVERNYTVLAEVMTENHERIAALGGSGEAIDALIEACVLNGARAAKLAGAGLGGTVIALTEDADQLEAGLRAAGYSRFLRPTQSPGVTLEMAPNSE